MTQNRSTAVMQQRKEAPDSLDYFPTPPWATRALCERLMRLQPLTMLNCWEPACGEGHMARPLAEYFNQVFASDVHDYTATYPDQDFEGDFLTDWDHPTHFMGTDCGPDWVITNPPFNLAEQFVFTSLRRAREGCAMLLRTSFLEGQARYKSLFSVNPPSLILQFTERVPMFKGHLDRTGSSATSYCWLVWETRPGLTGQFEWIAPCRKRLEQARDYPDTKADPAAAPLFEGVKHG
ncbi:MAG: hypothetical protein ACRBB0_27135 [Pelagimonas sp.]|uniref:hypothetical protein n=1 Tax=Pelagimonas sp. TaxID=2073170 RepID=UPI003D6BB45F